MIILADMAFYMSEFYDFDNDQISWKLAQRNQDDSENTKWSLFKNHPIQFSVNLGICWRMFTLFFGDEHRTVGKLSRVGKIIECRANHFFETSINCDGQPCFYLTHTPRQFIILPVGLPVYLCLFVCLSLYLSIFFLFPFFLSFFLSFFLYFFLSFFLSFQPNASLKVIVP